MVQLREEVQSFIRASEGIQAMIAQGVLLTPDELEVLELCAVDLMSALRVRKPSAEKQAGTRNRPDK